MADVGGVFRKLFPFISAAASIGGPIGVMAAAAVGNALGVEKIDPSNLEDAITKAQIKDPDALIKLEQAEHDFQLQMEKLGLDSAAKLEEIAATDRANARAREIAVHDKTPMILAFLITLGFFALLALVAFHSVEAASMPILQIMIGALGAAFTGIVSYFFGSSAGSARKSETISKIATGP